ncbi:UNVERIFIED_CONTAM: Photosystem I chlorophyll a apoprotein A1 [Sesamum radiatum]|uniref:Photosystem I chlorophyll a apoprotein A1 n=1 Tax=Sesamum radiatum TaxID=300843 RepID=A0AAW2P5R7_SESRA
MKDNSESALSHFSRTIAKGLDTTTWIWNLHADAHDFDSHTSDLEEISRKVFSAHFGQLSIIFLWLSGMYFHGARFSNYEVAGRHGNKGDLLDRHYRIAPFDERYEQEASRKLVFSELYEASKQTANPWVFEPEYPGKSRIFDGRTGILLNNPL